MAIDMLMVQRCSKSYLRVLKIEATTLGGLATKLELRPWTQHWKWSIYQTTFGGKPFLPQGCAVVFIASIYPLVN